GGDVGLMTGRKKPNQFAAGSGGARNHINYDAHRVHQASITNELGHVVYTDYDLGTGVLVSTRGPNSVSCGSGCTEYEEVETEIDGFGRPLHVYVTTEDPTDGTYRKMLSQAFTYYDHEEPRRVRNEKRIDWGGDKVVVDTWYDGFGRVLRRKEYRFESGKPDREDSFAYDQQGNIARLVTSDPSVDDGSDVTYTYSFDALNRPSSATRPDPDLQGPGEDLVVTWEYNGLSTTYRASAQDGGPP